MDEEPKPPLADDPDFLASLDDLDRGLSNGRNPHQTDALHAAASPPAPASQPPTTDPDFLASLDDLDRGLSESPGPHEPPQSAVVPFPLPVPTHAATVQEHPQPNVLQHAPGDVPFRASVAPPQRPAPRSRQDLVVSSSDGTLEYQQFYGFTEKPFDSSPDPKFFYHSTAHDGVARDLLDAIRNRAAVVVVTGEAGTGKTMLYRAVVEQLDHRTLTSLVVDPVASIEDLLRTLLVDFGVISREDLSQGKLAHASLDDLRRAFGEFLSSLSSLQAFAVVLIDDAQNMPVRVLGQLHVLLGLQGERRLLQIVLVGRPSLLRVLARSELRSLAERTSVNCRLEPMAEEEVAAYVQHRIANAGRNPRVELNDEALARVYELSAGVPRVINVLCDRALTLGAQSALGVIDEELISRAADDLEIVPPEPATLRLARRALAAVCAVALFFIGAAGAGYVFHDRLTQLILEWQAVPSTPPSPQPAALPLLQPLPLPPEMGPATRVGSGPREEAPRRASTGSLRTERAMGGSRARGGERV